MTVRAYLLYHIRKGDGMENSNVNIDLIRSHVDTIILRALYDEDKYGYEILNEIKEKSKGLYMLKQPTLYSCLKRLEKQGYIRSYKGDVSNGAQRVYYSLQPEGRTFLENDQQQWEFSRTIINSLLSDKEFDPSSLPPFDPSAYRPMTKRQRNPQSYAEYMASIKGEDEAEAQTAASEDDNEVIAPIPVVASADDERKEEPEKDAEPSSFAAYPASEPAFSKESEDEISRSVGEERYERTYAPDYSRAYGQSEEFAPKREDRFRPVEENREKAHRREDVAAYRQEPEKVNYIASFDSIYSKPQNDLRDYAGHSERDADDGDSVRFLTLNELRSKFMAEGYTVKPYVKKNSSEYYINNYYYSSRLLRDCSLIFYAIFAVEVLIAYFATFRMTDPPTSVGYLFMFLGIGLLFPILCAVNWFVDPTKRIKAKFSLRSTLINSLIFMLNALILIVVLGFFVFGADIEVPSTSVKPIIVPILFLLDIPVAILIYYMLYKSKRYHVS